MARNRTRPFSFLLIALLLASFALVACGDDDDDDGGADTPPAGDDNGNGENGGDDDGNGNGDVTISVGDNFFDPEEVTVAVGTTVTWNWGGANPHSVVGDFAESELLTGSGSFSHTFEEAGSFDYLCGVHGATMPGTIVVE